MEQKASGMSGASGDVVPNDGGGLACNWLGFRVPCYRDCNERGMVSAISE